LYSDGFSIRFKPFLPNFAAHGPMAAEAISTLGCNDVVGSRAAVSAAVNHKDLDAMMALYAPGQSLFVFDVVGPPSTHRG
ncbi:MAG TPA: hypothetical protein VGO93_06635, partial [Candidatus Xenobia bacterium]